MKHLKKFNESYERKEELKYFCENRLVYLLDDRFKFSITRDLNNSFKGKETLLFTFSKYARKLYENDEDYDEFKWNDIKDHFIPFLTHLSNNYEIYGKVQISLIKPSKRSTTYIIPDKVYTIQEMIDDKPSELDCYLYEIEMSIK